jgi:hypothetical protein
MDRLTDEQITQKAEAILGRGAASAVEVARAAIIATLTEYAPHLLPRDPDEELAERLVNAFNKLPTSQLEPTGAWIMRFALYVIKHLDKERGK